MSKIVKEVIGDMTPSLPASLAQQLYVVEGIDFAQMRFDREALTKALQRYSSEAPLDAIGIKTRGGLGPINKVLKRALADEDSSRDFAHRLVDTLFSAGLINMERVRPEVGALIRDVVKSIDQIKGASTSQHPEDVLRDLRAIDRKILGFIDDDKHTSTNGMPVSRESKLTQVDYWALNEQHSIVAKAVKSLERRILRSVAADLKVWLKANALFTEKELEVLSKKDRKLVGVLIDLGLVHATEIPGRSTLFAYPHGEVNPEQFEKLVTPREREALASSIREELRKRYSGKVRSLGIAEIREAGVATLLDKKRVRLLSKETGFKAGHIVAALKYFESVGLLQRNDDGFELSPMGAKAGMGVRVVEAVKRKSDQSPALLKRDLSSYLTAARQVREEQQTPTYRLRSAKPGLPSTMLLDDVCIPDANLHQGLLHTAVQGANNGGSQGLVVVGNLLSGPAEINRGKVRRWAKPIPMTEQRSLGFEFLQSLKSPCINLLGRSDDTWAERRAFKQALREQHISDSGKVSSEDQVDREVARLNDQSRHSRAQQLATKIAEWAQFINLVVQPLETKLGRELYDSEVVERETHIEMNELELIRAISRRIIEKGCLVDAHNAIAQEYDSYLQFVQKKNKDLLEHLERVLFSAKENIAAGEIVSRMGCSIVAGGPSALDPEYSVVIVPDFNYGDKPRRNPTAAYEGLLRSKRNQGHEIADMHLLFSTGELVGELGSHGAWIISGGTLQGSPDLPHSNFHVQAVRGRTRRDETVYGLPAQSSFVTLSGGVHGGRVTQAIEYQIVTPKLLEVMDRNRERRLKRRSADVYVTSDWQIGSPTMQPEMILAGMIEAVDRGVEEILINGDIRQGMNYLRYTQECQLVEYPLNGLDSQAQYIYELFNPVLAYIRARKDRDTNFKIPTFHVLPGNHESNSQANKGLQGTWFVQDIAEKLRSYMAGWLKDEDLANRHVVCPEQFISHDGTPVDYPMIYLNRLEDLGICIQATHYNAVGGKGSSFSPTVSGVARAVHSLGVAEPHIRIESHMHVPGFQVRNGIVCVRTGANATGSAFEEHLLYANAPEANLFINLNSHALPRFFVATRSYQETRYDYLLERLHEHGVMKSYRSFKEFCHEKRKLVSLKKRGNPTDLSRFALHAFG